MGDFIFLILLLCFNAIFILSEIAILTSTKAKLHKISLNGNKGAKVALNLIQQPEVFLSAMQIGVTLMNGLLGLLGGTFFIEYLKNLLDKIPYINSYLHQYNIYIASFISMCVVTYLAVLSEILPKRIAMLQPEKIAVHTAYITSFVIKVFYPFAFILTVSTKYFLKCFKIQDTSSSVSIEEIKFIINQAVNSGTIHKTEHDLLKRLINLTNMQVGTIMTPRNKIISLNIGDNEKINLEKIKKNPFNYFPVINDTLDQIIGILSVKTLLGQKEITNTTLYELSKTTQLVYIPEMAKITKVLDLFSEKHVKIALVLNEYGEIEGIITINDIMRTFLGDLAILMEGKTPGLIKKSDGSMIVDGNMSIDELKELLQINSFPGDDEEDYRTLASFILRQLDTLPKQGDVVFAENWSFKVIKMDKLRVDRVLIKTLQED